MGFKNFEFPEWMNIAKIRDKWANLVDYTFSFPAGTYARTNSKHANAILKSFKTLQ